MDYVRYEIINNNSKVYYNGSSWNSNNYGKFKIVAKLKLIDKSNKIPYYLCTFDAKNTFPVSSTKIKSGNVKNKYARTVSGVGFFGYGKYDKRSFKKYKLWADMIYRCYSEDYIKRRPTYKDVTVDPRWHNFQNFCEDIVNLENFMNWDNYVGDKNIWQLDKDIKSKHEKIYSADTCKFVTNKENTARHNKKQTVDDRLIIAKNLDNGKVEEFRNQTEFAENNNMSQSAISACLMGNMKHCNRWAFKYQGETRIISKRAIIVGIRISDQHKEEFSDIKLFCETLNISRSHVGSCLNKKRKQHCGWTFEYKLNQIGEKKYEIEYF